MENKRLGYIENLRAALTVIVILQHAMRAYGRIVWWFVSDDPAPALERFAAVNSTFFMSLFFFISFYFMPGAYDRKGFGRFHADRLKRLFVPLVIYGAIVSSAMMYAYFSLCRNYGRISFPDYFSGYYLGLAGKPADWNGPSWPDVNLGPLWFVEHLLVYGLLYSLFRLLTRHRPPSKMSLPFPANWKILVLAISLGALAFLVRLRYPLYQWTSLFGFLQAEPAHLPFYLAMFVLGILAYRNEWLAKMPGKAGNLWLVVGSMSAAAVAIHPVDARFCGGFGLGAFGYAMIEAFACVGLVIGLLYWFWKRFDGRNALMETLSRHSYLAFIIHMPIVVFLQFFLSRFRIDPCLKFAICSAVSVPATFGASILLKKLPWIGKYL